MSFKKWLRGATRIRFDDRTLGNLTKNLATGAGAALGGVPGLALAGIGSAAGQAMLPGSNIGDIAGAGLRGAGTAGALHSGVGALRSIGSSAGAAAPGVANAPVAGASTVGTPGMAPLQAGVGGVPSVTALPPTASSGALSRIGGRLKALPRHALDFAKENPTSAALGLQAAGNLATSGTENRLLSAQAAELERRTGESEYESQRRQERERALQPLWSTLGQSLGRGLRQSTAAPNPYVPQ